MDNRQFDVLLQRVARQTSRRAALAALLGGALLLHDPVTSEATKKAKLRKKRRRKARSSSHRGMSILVDNSASTQSVIIAPGAVGDGVCCAAGRTVTIAAGGKQTFETPFATAWVFINNKYWFQITNPLIGKPYLAIALNGTFTGHNESCCQGMVSGATVEFSRSFSEGQSRSYTIQGPVFSVIRNRDKPGHKHFTVKLPATI